jgi:hypothetical protein
MRSLFITRCRALPRVPVHEVFAFPRDANRYPKAREKKGSTCSYPCSMSALASKRQLNRGHSGKATIRPGNESALKQSLRSHPWLGLPGWTCVCFAFTISRMTIIKTPTCYLACASFVTTAATLSSIWFQPSI